VQPEGGTDRFRRSLPWGVSDLVVVYATTFIGLLLVFLAWFETSASVRLKSQVHWTNVGVAGVIVLGAGNLLWLLRGKRATGQLRRLVLPLVPVDDESPIELRRTGPLVAGAGMTRFHLAACPLVSGKQVTAANKDAHVRAGRAACGVCLPLDTGP
jgi:hypothetical protein